MPKNRLTFHPLTRERWPDLEKLFGARGACGGCWCMYGRLPRSEFDRGRGERNRRALRRLARAGRAPGLLAYRGAEPVGWCAVGPREDFPTLGRSRTLRPPDDRPVWSVVCFFVQRGERGRGVSVSLLKAACEHVRKSGGEVLEGYPVQPAGDRMPDVFAWSGLISAFEKAGFRETARPSKSRAIMRIRIGRRKRP